MLSDLITSKSRIKLLSVFLGNPFEMFHVRELVRRTGDEINAVRRELLFLEKKGIMATGGESLSRLFCIAAKGL